MILSPSPHACTDGYSAEDFRRILHRSLEFFSVQCPPFVPLSCELSLDSQLHLLISESPPDSIWTLDPYTMSRKLTPGSKLGNHEAHFICFPSLRDHCILFPDVKCFAKHFQIYFVCFVYCFRRENNPAPVTLL